MPAERGYLREERYPHPAPRGYPQISDFKQKDSASTAARRLGHTDAVVLSMGWPRMKSTCLKTAFRSISPSPIRAEDKCNHLHDMCRRYCHQATDFLGMTARGD